jgi:hypothetical protein
MDNGFEVKDSGERINYQSGMRRDTQKGKPNFRLIDLGFLKRLAVHLTKGAEKYGRDNWRLANSQEELDRFQDSAFRHLMQYLNGETDEDHGMAVVFNIMAAENVKEKLKKEDNSDAVNFFKNLEYEDNDLKWASVRNVYSPIKTTDKEPAFVYSHDPKETPTVIPIKTNPLQITLELLERLNRAAWPDGEVSVRASNRFVIFDVVWPKYKLSRRYDYYEIKSVYDPEWLIDDVEQAILRAKLNHKIK